MGLFHNEYHPSPNALNRAKTLKQLFLAFRTIPAAGMRSICSACVFSGSLPPRRFLERPVLCQCYGALVATLATQCSCSFRIASLALRLLDQDMDFFTEGPRGRVAPRTALGLPRREPLRPVEAAHHVTRDRARVTWRCKCKKKKRTAPRPKRRQRHGATQSSARRSRKGRDSLCNAHCTCISGCASLSRALSPSPSLSLSASIV